MTVFIPTDKPCCTCGRTQQENDSVIVWETGWLKYPVVCDECIENYTT